MDCNRLSQTKRAKSLSRLLVCVLLVVLAQTPPLLGQSKPELVLEITVSDATSPKIRLGGRYGSGGGASLVLRKSLSITDPNAANGFTAIDVNAMPEGNAIRVTLSVIYNDVNVQEWWRNKDEKPGGSYLIREGEASVASELTKFGIEPF